jgi:hypothetical protein
MPYQSDGQWERASTLGHVPTVVNEHVRERLSHYRRPEGEFDAREIQALVTPRSDLPMIPGGPVKWVVSVDGSNHEYEEAFNQFPSTRVLYLQVAGVLIRLDQYLHHPGRFVNPAQIADATVAEVVSGVLPSSFLVHDELADPYEAFRAELFELFQATLVGGQTLLDVLLWVRGHGENDDAQLAGQQLVRVSVCPNATCLDPNTGRRRENLQIPFDRPGICPACRARVWPTDLLRLHDEWRHDAKNGDVAGRARSVIEHLTLVGVARERRPYELTALAFVFDGPLALFGTVAPLRTGLLRAWQGLFKRCADQNLPAPLVFGVKKGGYAVEHLHAIAQHVVGDIPTQGSGAVMRLTHAYLHERLQTTSLSETYIGRRFYYCSPMGGQYVLTIPPLAGPAYAKAEATGEDLSGLNRFPQLRRICNLVDQIGTHLFEDALIPVALAHSYAAYPLTQAQHVLRLFTEETLGSGA